MAPSLERSTRGFKLNWIIAEQAGFYLVGEKCSVLGYVHMGRQESIMTYLKIFYNQENFNCFETKQQSLTTFMTYLYSISQKGLINTFLHTFLVTSNLHKLILSDSHVISHRNCFFTIYFLDFLALLYTIYMLSNWICNK